jgi:oxygen-independent coproporphyrinogen-3 oxidase
MSKELSFFIEKTVHHTTFDKLSGLMQFPIVEKQEVKNILNDSEYTLFAEKMGEYVGKELLTEDKDNYYLTSDGIFWGNNMSKTLLRYMADGLFKK